MIFLPGAMTVQRRTGVQNPAAAKRAFEAMMVIRKIDIAAIEAAPRG